MPKGYPFQVCRECGEPFEHRSELSRTGRHIDCAIQVQKDATLQLVNHAGPVFEHWRRRMAACVGGALLDDAHDAP